MKLQEQISRMKSMMGLLIEEEEKIYENKPIVFVGTAGAGKSTTSIALAERLQIPRIDVDAMEGSNEYSGCTGVTGAKLIRTITPDNHEISSSNKEYRRCVLENLLDKYANTSVVLDVGGDSSVENADLLINLPNVFAIGVPPKPEDDKPYLEMLRQRKIERLEKKVKKSKEDTGKIPDELIKSLEQEKNASQESVQMSINQIREYYRGKQEINIFDENGESKTTEQLVKEIIGKLT